MGLAHIGNEKSDSFKLQSSFGFSLGISVARRMTSNIEFQPKFCIISYFRSPFLAILKLKIRMGIFQTEKNEPPSISSLAEGAWFISQENSVDVLIDFFD